MSFISYCCHCCYCCCPCKCLPLSSSNDAVVIPFLFLFSDGIIMRWPPSWCRYPLSKRELMRLWSPENDSGRSKRTAIYVPGCAAKRATDGIKTKRKKNKNKTDKQTSKETIETDTANEEKYAGRNNKTKHEKLWVEGEREREMEKDQAYKENEKEKRNATYIYI